MSEVTVHQAFRAVALSAPSAIALRGDDETLTYGELDRRSTQWANYLRRCGVARGARVGTFLSGSPEALVILLGILKAGGTYCRSTPPTHRNSFVTC